MLIVSFKGTPRFHVLAFQSSPSLSNLPTKKTDDNFTEGRFITAETTEKFPIYTRTSATIPSPGNARTALTFGGNVKDMSWGDSLAVSFEGNEENSVYIAIYASDMSASTPQFYFRTHYNENFADCGNPQNLAFNKKGTLLAVSWNGDVVSVVSTSKLILSSK